MEKHKSEKIHQVIHGSSENLNLHEIKARTGAGNGYKSDIEVADELGDYNDFTHKSHKIEQVIQKSNEDLNLHEIKARTGAGSGYKHHQ